MLGDNEYWINKEKGIIGVSGGGLGQSEPAEGCEEPELVQDDKKQGGSFTLTFGSPEQLPRKKIKYKS